MRTKMKSRLMALVVISFAAMLTFSFWIGCKAKPIQKEAPSIPSLKIGVILPYSGQLAAFGEEGKQGINLAIEEARALLKDKLEINVVYEDSKGDPADSVRGFRKLVEVDKVDAVIGEVASSNTLAIAPVADELKVPLVVPASTDKDITVGRQFVVRVCFLDPQQGLAMAGFAYNELGARKVAILYDKGNDYSVGLAEAFSTAFKTFGGKISGETTLKPEDQDFRAQLVQIRDWHIDSLFLPVNYPQAAQVMRQAAGVGLDCTFLGGDAWSSPELFEIGGDAVSGYITAHFASDNASGKVKEFVDKFKAKYGVEPSNMAALSYDAAGMLITAASKVDNISSELLRKELFNTKDYHGATGTFSIGSNGNPTKEIQILEVKDGHFAYVKTIMPKLAY